MSPELHGRVRSLFDLALERPEADRLSFLQSACPDDPEVLQAVARLLEAHVGAESFLEDDTRPTRRIGRYLATGELGRGAMGIVYEAVDPLIGRKVAVKVIHLQDFADAGEAHFLRERLFREARSAGALSHPGIVTVYDVGQEGDLAYIAMERVEGSSLYQALAAGGTIPRAEALEILRQTAAALDYAHRNGVVHRDIKPANIMLDKGMMVKIADFGIAKITSAEHHTLTGLVMGTPSYMSPEQIEALALDGRSDQFSLAVVAYELLTGRRPFHAESLATLAHMIVYADRPSARAVNPALPAAVDIVFHRSLAKVPAERYASCCDFVGALEEASKATRIPAAVIQSPLPNPAKAPAPLAAGRGKRGVSLWVRDFLLGSVGMLVLLAGVFLFRPQGKTQAAPVVMQFLAEPQSIVSGSKTTLRWDVKGATEVVIDPGVGKVAASGPFEVTPVQATTYVLTATGPGGKVTAPALVNVTPAPGKDRQKARQLCGDAESQLNAHQLKKARELFLEAANLGEPRCMADLGEIYMEDDYPEAVRWFRKAADAGNSSGMLHLGAMYYFGTGVPLNFGTAASWYRKAADAGNADAMYNLGRMYESGEGVPKDLQQAKALYLQASGLGNADANARLARLTAMESKSLKK